ncbi:putative copper-transporting ATPase HMA5 [Prunus yedoensis var. nudiflora]|uniref:Putative copper-transporting ATPase HMA5 n=1 Tax=Prunus yedoensis var. nudiflora TaxID=2094558 RepID=A0A314UX34_PRUYE|nr:putative copper-transporting ATPase HMA5 [Prunus yedoensis var. nudiflora]
MDDLKVPLLKPLDNNNKDIRIRTVKFKIGDIECASCATTIESVLGKLDGVKNATVSPIQGQAAVNYIPELINVSEV